jgi:3-hydroxyacyl-[acyl-carrier-protein] dehydratase
LHGAAPLRYEKAVSSPSIPHRDPFLFVVQGEGDARDENGTPVVHARFDAKNPYVSDGSEDPVVPRMLVLEALAQAMAVVANRDYDKTQQGFLVMVRSVEFKGDVRCSDSLALSVKHTRTYANLVRYQTHACVGGRVVCEAEIMAAHQGDA